MAVTNLVALKTFKHNGGRPRKALQIDVITVPGSLALSRLADRFAQACSCTAIIGTTHRAIAETW
jgi:6,7-dimethyl-8-ribityllumazine synthase